MTKKKASAAQLAARKLFAERAKAGTLKKRVKKNPTTKKRRGPSKVNAPSQSTGKKPTKRLQERRRKNTRTGTYPNPLQYKVQYCNTDIVHEKNWHTLASFKNKDTAHEYAKALASTRRYKAIRVAW